MLYGLGTSFARTGDCEPAHWTGNNITLSCNVRIDGLKLIFAGTTNSNQSESNVTALLTVNNSSLLLSPTEMRGKKPHVEYVLQDINLRLVHATLPDVEEDVERNYENILIATVKTIVENFFARHFVPKALIPASSSIQLPLPQ